MGMEEEDEELKKLMWLMTLGMFTPLERWRSFKMSGCRLFKWCEHFGITSLLKNSTSYSRYQTPLFIMERDNHCTREKELEKSLFWLLLAPKRERSRKSKAMM